MKRRLILLCLVFMLASPSALYALDDIFEKGMSTNSDSGALLNVGIWALTHSDKLLTLPDKIREKEERDKKAVSGDLDKKVDDAIQKAWDTN
jgi:hypothetical protein